jgi:hypothetical protein
MRLVPTSIIVLGATAMLAFSASAGAAQNRDTTSTRSDTGRKAHSERRIRISKAASGEVVRVDTVMVTKEDTVTVTRVDTVATTNTVTVTKYETTTVQLPPPPRIVRYPDGMYFGVAGGASFPTGSLFNPNNTGPSAQAQVGWQKLSFPIGVRIDANYARPAEDAGYAYLSNTHANLWNFNGDVKLGLPIITHMFGISPRFSLYAIGGVSYVNFDNALVEMDPPAACAGTANVCYDSGSHGEWGWNAGGGGSLSFGRTELFIESRVISFTPNGSHNAREIPVMFGINWFGGSATR